jgi:hypothetical protein
LEYHLLPGELVGRVRLGGHPVTPSVCVRGGEAERRAKRNTVNP